MTQSDEALVEQLARKLCWWILSYSGTEYVEEKRVDDEWRCWLGEARAILPILTAREASARAGVLHIGTMKVWRGQTPGTIFIQQDDGEGGEFPEADLEAIWQSYYAENF